MCVCFGQVSLRCFNSCTPGIIEPPPLETPLPYERLSPLPTPCFKMFWKDLLMTPQHPTSSIFHCYPLPMHHTFSPHKNVDHTLRCSAIYGVYNMSVVSVMFLYRSRNNGGPHRNCTLYTRVASDNPFLWNLTKYVVSF